MRQTLLFNDSWYFTKDSVEISDKINDSMIPVTLPHTWNNEDGQDGGNDYYRGKCSYVKKFKRTDLPDNDVYYLEFLGANSSAEVYLNNRYLASHDGGYSTWRVDITGAVEDENTLIVKVDNSPNNHVYPQMADFTFYGGLYRNVNLIATSKAHFDLDYYGGPGIAITPCLKNDEAEVEVYLYLNDEAKDKDIHLYLKDMQGNVIDEICTKNQKESFVVKQPHLWNGRKDPYLYSVDACLKDGDKLLDNISSRFGIRTYEIDAQKGFILNGESYPLRGVSRHQDRKGIGNALSAEHHLEDMKLIYEVGANTIRLAHYQHDPYFYDLCDEYGMVVWAEIPYISKHMPEANDNTVSQMKELVVQNYNHPSIVVWGLSNEITVSGDVNEDLLNNHIKLNDLVHSLDKTRKTTIACVSMLPEDSKLLNVTDVISYNHYFGWYGGDTSMNGPWFDHFHELHPDIPVGLSEYGCEALNWHTSNPKQGDYTEEYQAYYHEELIKQIAERPYLWATHVWNMFDFGADGRQEGGENGQNHKGLVTFDRTYKKDSFYAYKAWWSDEPFVHICGKRYIDRVEDTTKVTVYSNLPEVSLYLNGSLYETKHSDNHFFYFDVPNKDTTTITAKAGECSDESIIKKVEVFNEDYRLKEVGAVLNWFDITEIDGYYSLNDTMGDIMKSPEGRQIMDALTKNVLSGAGKASAGMEIGEGVIKMMNGFTIVRLVNMMAGTIGLDIPKEKLLELNSALNKIPK